MLTNTGMIEHYGLVSTKAGITTRFISWFRSMDDLNIETETNSARWMDHEIIVQSWTKTATKKHWSKKGKK